MDYGCGSALRFILVVLIFISYDIACQWFVNLHHRIESWPEEIKPKEGVVLVPLIPKLHEHGHSFLAICVKVLDLQMASVQSAFGAHTMQLQIQQKLWVQVLVMMFLMITLGSGTMRNMWQWVCFKIYLFRFEFFE